MVKNITVVGAGSWGTALAQVLCDNQNHVTLYDLSQEIVDDINQNHQNSRFFEGIKLPIELKATTSLKDALKLIDSPIIVQVHRSYAVSMMYIKEVDKNNIILKDETCITLGKKYVDEFMFQYREYLIS